MMSNFIGLIIAYVYIFSVLAVAEWLRRRRGYGGDFTRKFVHIGVGMLIWLVPFLFDRPWLFVFASLTFVVLNLLDWRYGYFSAMAAGDRANLGTVYFPLAAAVVAIIFWNQPPLMVAALMPLTWGDGLASVIGRKFGAHEYVVLDHVRTLEGSATFFIASSVATWLALWLVTGPPEITPAEAVPTAITVALASTMVEAVSPWGLDNLTVTAASTALLGFWPF